MKRDNDPDETAGRAMCRAAADSLAHAQMSIARRTVRIVAADNQLAHMAAEFGFKKHEQGTNLEAMHAQLDEVLKAAKE